MAATIMLGSAAIGAGSSLYNMFGGGKNDAPPPYSVGMPQGWSPDPATMNAVSNQVLQSSIPGIGNYNLYPGLMPYAQDTFRSLYNNPGAAGAVSGAQSASNLGTMAAKGAFDAGGGLYGRAGELYPQAQRLFEMGFDPQSALYSRTAQQVTDAERAAQAARGIATTPYGAGLEGQTLSNFNIDWQNNLLQRAIAGAGAGGQLYGQGADLTRQGAGLQAGAAPLYMQSAMYPYATNAAIGQGQMGALTGLGQFGAAGAALPQQQIDDYLRYIAAGTGATGAATGVARTGLEQQRQAFEQNQQQMQNQMGFGSQLGGSMQQLGKNWPASWSTGWGRQNYPGGTPFNLNPAATFGQPGSAGAIY